MPVRTQFATEEEWLAHLWLWFAGMAMQGLTRLYSPDVEIYAAGDDDREQLASHNTIAGWSSKLADAMIAERQKQKPGEQPKGPQAGSSAGCSGDCATAERSHPRGKTDEGKG